MTIRVDHLFKSYGDNLVLDDVSLDFRAGAITGLLGPNGAGKTTLVSILMGIIAKDRGRVLIDGLDLDRDRDRIQARASIVPQSFAFYPTLTTRENLEYFGALYGFKGRRLETRMDAAIDAGSLQSFLGKRAAELSGGMKRRLNLAIGLLNEPATLYLDEPTVGVDAQSRSYLLERIDRINRERGTTILYASHYMEEIEQISHDIAIIDAGRIILHDRKEDILARRGAVTLTLDRLPGTLKEALERVAGLRVEAETLVLDRNEDLNRTLAGLFDLLARHGAEVRALNWGNGHLEALFLELTERTLRDE
jgi:ABC-2 type transport system ATP-binding protein